jgi:hypothetical protein
MKKPLNLRLELAKVAFATFCTVASAILPIFFLVSLVFRYYGEEHFMALCVFSGLAAWPVVWTSLYFSSALAGFFVSVWGSNWIVEERR